MTYIYPLHKLPEEKAAFAGGKAKSLSHMMKNTKIRIPGGYVILSCAFEGKHLCGEALGELDELINNLDGNATYAIRSSALNEDGEEASFAGQYETVTDVRKEDISKAVEQVAASLGNVNVIAYTKNRVSGGDSGPQFGGEAFPERQDNGIGIVIQKFIKAKFAGSFLRRMLLPAGTIRWSAIMSGEKEKSWYPVRRMQRFLR